MRNQFIKQMTPSLILSIIAVVFGFAVRLVQYLSNRSLWGDEASISLNIINRSYSELLTPLSHNQAAPPGFLTVEKLAVQLFGNSEYSLRLFPLISSAIALCALVWLVTYYTSKITAPIAIAFFACLPYLVYYATEVKQYSSDVAIALLLFILLLSFRTELLNRNQIILLSLLGSIAIWFSHPSIFILSGVELSSLVILPRSRRLSWLIRRFPVYLSWLTSFILLYWLTIRPTLKNDVLTASFEGRYPESWFDLLWLFDALGRFFYRPLGFFGFTDGIAILAFILGCIAFYRQNKMFLLTLISPFITTLLAAYLQKYPFRERLILFLAPFAIIIIAKGISWMLESGFLQFRGISIFGVSLFTILLIPRAISASEVFIEPNTVAEIRPVLQYIQKQKEPQDMLYIYPSGVNPFRYYAAQYQFSSSHYRIGQWDIKKAGREKLDPHDLQGFKSELSQLQGQRVWLILSDVSALEEETIFSYLSQFSQPINCYRKPGAVTCLYPLPTEF
ncbi:hypothetical protein PCC7418_1407 [Halothece sp. PCC 7418]|uniref:hypothetical protein n=1 Tax=Halothece sp. (strain PCC 7418) TaxID=65093 RepID=UPI0002A07E76|nr:hypothetical protein [Halothece sp. PCC 7418]AFZ43602.1 hypothetical protein PCC7418_1407 [Halothece sp. PCC 7418]